MALAIQEAQVEAIRQFGASAYPFECCGVMLGDVNGADKKVREVILLKNLRNDPRTAQGVWPLQDPATETARNRFLLDPVGQLQVEKDARMRGLKIVGYFHSHPDHPARPSRYDSRHAWPGYSYVIVSVERGIAKQVSCWVLAKDGESFCPEQVEVAV